MIVSELIEKLRKQPQDARVYLVDYEGCSECNSEAMPHHSNVYDVKFQAEGEYPSHDLKNIVVIQ